MRSLRKVSLAVAALAVAGLAGYGAAAAAAPGGGNSNEVGSASQQARPAIAGPARPINAGQVFTPIDNCRIANTAVKGGSLGNNVTRSFYVRGSAGFASQGGFACGIPNEATAISARIIAIVPNGKGTLYGGATGSGRPYQVLTFYVKGSNSATGVTIRLGGGDRPLSLYNVGGPTHVVIDVNGYYAPQLAGFVQSDGTLAYSTPQVVSASHDSTGNYTVTFARDVSKCSFTVTPYAYNWVVAVGPGSSPNTAKIFIHDQVSPFTQHDTSFFIEAVC